MGFDEEEQQLLKIICSKLIIFLDAYLLFVFSLLQKSCISTMFSIMYKNTKQ